MAQLFSISLAEAREILEKNRMTEQDRFRLQSYTVAPLADSCKDLMYSDYDIIHSLEEKNLYRVLNTSGILAGVMGEDVRNELLGLRIPQIILDELKPSSSLTKRESDRSIYMMLMRHVLSNFNQDPRADPVFVGKMPQKVFQFRQQTAIDWFKNVVFNISIAAGYVYADLGLEDALAYVMGYIAHYLNRSNPGKYYADPKLNNNDNIGNIIQSYISSVSGDNRIINPLYSSTRLP